MKDLNSVTPLTTEPNPPPHLLTDDPSVTHQVGSVADFLQDRIDSLVDNTLKFNTAEITEHKPVIASCGKKVGVVDHMEGQVIKLTKADSEDGLHHFIPLSWVESVDHTVHLNRNSDDTEREWQTEAASS